MIRYCCLIYCCCRLRETLPIIAEVCLKVVFIISVVYLKSYLVYCYCSLPEILIYYYCSLLEILSIVAVVCLKALFIFFCNLLAIVSIVAVILFVSFIYCCCCLPWELYLLFLEFTWRRCLLLLLCTYKAVLINCYYSLLESFVFFLLL